MSGRAESTLSSPTHLGYAMPAEWETHQGTWLSWPHNPDTWPDHLAEVESFYIKFIAAIAADETVFLNVVDEPMESRAHALLTKHGITGDIRYLRIPTNDAWCRDYGPTILIQRQAQSSLPARLGVTWEYNAWGGKYPPYEADNAAALLMARSVGIPTVAGGIVAEGGAFDVNGEGLLLTTDSCLLNPNRNPGANKEVIEEHLRTMLGVCEILWLGGAIAGDDTDGHIDNLARFTGPREVVAVYAEEDQHGRHTGLRENYERLAHWTDQTGRGLRVRRLPVPDFVLEGHGTFPASYANFYLTNRSVLVPTFGCPQDDAAVQVLAECFPDRRMVRIDCRDAIRGLGALHCLSQQIPAAK